MTLSPRPSHFSACNIEKLGGAGDEASSERFSSTFQEFLLLLAVRLGLWHKLPSFVDYKFSKRYVHIDNYIHVTIFLQPDWNALYVPPGQGSATLLTRPVLTRARRGLGMRLGGCLLSTLEDDIHVQHAVRVKPSLIPRSQA